MTEVTETKPEPPKPVIKSQPVQTRSEIFTPPVIVEKVDRPIPTQDEFKDCKDIMLGKKRWVMIMTVFPIQKELARAKVFLKRKK